MKKLVIRADDLGYSEAVNRGIEKTVREGLVRSVGLMPNIPEATPGWQMIADCDIAVGQHTNLCLGTPCADPERIPTLVDERGQLLSSRAFREAFARGEELASIDDMATEIEAQYLRFREIVGRDPDYFEAHAVASKSLNEALARVAEKYDLAFLELYPDTLSGFFKGNPVKICPMGSFDPDYDASAWFKMCVEQLDDEIPSMFIGHPGWLDDFIMCNSSLNINRTREAAALSDPALAAWLAEQDVELLDYRQL